MSTAGIGTLNGAATAAALALKADATNTAISGGTIAALTEFGVRDTAAAYDHDIAATSSVTPTAKRTTTLDSKNTSSTLDVPALAAVGVRYAAGYKPDKFEEVLLASPATTIDLTTLDELSGWKIVGHIYCVGAESWSTYTLRVNAAAPSVDYNALNVYGGSTSEVVQRLTVGGGAANDEIDFTIELQEPVHGKHRMFEFTCTSLKAGSGTRGTILLKDTATVLTGLGVASSVASQIGANSYIRAYRTIKP
jgi:hypothetical protein